MNLHLNLANLETSTAEDINNPLPVSPLGALSQGLILYDFDFEKKGEDNNSESSWDNNEVQLPAFSKSQEAFSHPSFDYRAPEKLLENHSVIKNSILIDFEKRILRKSSIIAADKKRVSFRESPRDSSSHRRSRSESKNMVFFKLELITNEEPVARCVEAIDDEVMYNCWVFFCLI